MVSYIPERLYPVMITFAICRFQVTEKSPQRCLQFWGKSANHVTTCHGAYTQVTGQVRNILETWPRCHHDQMKDGELVFPPEV